MLDRPIPDAARPRAIARAWCAVAMGLATGTVAYGFMRRDAAAGAMANDFTYPWLAARALVHGQNPYRAMHVVAALRYREFFYPLPAAIVVAPLAWIGVYRVAGVLFVSLGAGWLAFVLTRAAWWPLLLFVSAPALQTAASAQWAFLMVAAALTWPAVGLLVAKPNIGGALFVAQTDRRAVVSAILGGAALLALSFLLQPTWLADWLREVRSAPSATQYRAPMLTVWGCVTALGLVRWRDPKARLLLVMACAPQNGLFYDQLPLLLVAESRIELLALVTIGISARVVAFLHQTPGMETVAVSAVAYPYMVMGCHWPALALVLRRHATRLQCLNDP